ncbi:MAG: GAF domain-containing protein, partial [Deltaproteobacteria bacterium]
MSIHNYEELAVLHAIAKTLAQPWDLRDQLEQVLKEMSSRLGMSRGMISLLDRDSGESWLEVAHGVNLEGLEISYLAGEGITGKVAQTGRPMAIPNLGKESLFLDRTGARRFLNREELSFLCVPIMYDSRVVGILSADKGAKNVTNLDSELALLASVAELIAKAVHVLSLEEENRRLRRIVNQGRAPSADIIGHSKLIQEVFGLISHVADSST